MNYVFGYMTKSNELFLGVSLNGIFEEVHNTLSRNSDEIKKDGFYIFSSILVKNILNDYIYDVHLPDS